VVEPSEENLGYSVIMIFKTLFALLMSAYLKQKAQLKLTF